jgi:hypothetical protein
MDDHPEMQAFERRLMWRNAGLLLGIVLASVALAVWTPVCALLSGMLGFAYSVVFAALETFLPWT